MKIAAKKKDSPYDALHHALMEMGRSSEDAAAVVSTVRHLWGGARPYFPKEPAVGKTMRLAADLALGVPLREAIERAGISQATAYRLMRRKWVTIW